MAENLRGYVLDNGFLVFGDGMIAAKNVEAVIVEPNRVGKPTAYIWLNGNIGHPDDEDSKDYSFKPMSPDQERNYRSMLLDCATFDMPDDLDDMIPAEASTGCEQENKPQFLIDTKQIGLLRNTYWMLRKRLFMDEVNPEMEKLCEYSCLNWSQLRGIFDGERRDL